jgi:hypothetical protein
MSRYKTSKLLKEARQYLAKTVRDYTDIYDGRRLKKRYLCNAIEFAAFHLDYNSDSLEYDWMKLAEKVNKRTAKSLNLTWKKDFVYTLDEWIFQEVLYPNGTCMGVYFNHHDKEYRELIQAHRVAWLEALILEHKARGD